MCVCGRGTPDSGYHGKQTLLPDFKSWVGLFAFHIVLINLGKVGIQLFSWSYG